MSDEMTQLGVVAAAAAIAKGEVTPLALTQAYLARIERLEPKLHAYAHVARDVALAEAAAMTTEAAEGRFRGPLHGVPVAVKDLFETKDAPTGAGFPALASRTTGRDATVVERLRAAGAIIIGKTCLSEGALALHHPEVTLPVNPWNADLWTGSSSSGSGVAVAAEVCAAAIGTDTGGSIRFPALCNGIVGLKPTWGRISRAGVFPLSWTLDHVGPMARKIEDVAQILSVIAGRDLADPTSLPDAVPDYMGELAKGVTGLRIGFDAAYATNGVLPETCRALGEAIRIFTASGGRVVDVVMPETRAANAAWTTICLSEAAAAHDALEAGVTPDYSEGFRAALDMGAVFSGRDYATANLTRRAFASAIDELFQSIDLMIVPVTGNPVPEVEEFHRICPDPEGLEQLIFYTCLYDVSGHPSLTVPAGLDDAGRPIAFQLVAGRLQEDLLLRAGKVWQDAFGWDGRPSL